ncbi:serine hydrolase-domain-containing protein [Aspergillus varians]
MLETLQVWPTPVPSYTEWIKPSPRLQQHSETSFTSTPATPQKDTTLHLPRLLFLHGGGTNARIFRSQCRGLRARLSPYFRIVFAEAPFYTTPGPDVVSVYEKWGPFRAWFPPGYGVGNSYNATVPISDSPAASKIVLSSIEQSIEAAMAEDDHAGGTGAWMGLLGFSQGAKMAASLLLRQQNTIPGPNRVKSGIDYRFAVLLAGRAPMVSLAQEDETWFPGCGAGFEPPLHLPTIHVHGMKDPGLPLHRELLDYGCEYGSARLIEWDGEHRVPIRSKDVMAVVDAMLDIARETGVIGRF